jgi:hypothetical protein
LILAVYVTKAETQGFGTLEAWQFFYSLIALAFVTIPTFTLFSGTIFQLVSAFSFNHASEDLVDFCDLFSSHQILSSFVRMSIFACIVPLTTYLMIDTQVFKRFSLTEAALTLYLMMIYMQVIAYVQMFSVFR